MPYIPKSLFERITGIGAQMSNICFNLSQNKEQNGSSSMRDCQQQWDKLMAEMREYLKRSAQ